MNKTHLLSGAFVAVSICLLSPAAGLARQPQKTQPEVISAERVTADITCLSGAGGNVGVLRGPEGLLVVDAKLASAAPDLLAAIRKVSPLPVGILVNTHHHRDHAGGNSAIGQGARIIAQHNCRAALLVGLAPGQSAAAIGAPFETFERELRLEFGGEVVRLIHFGPGHTAGDSVVVFEHAKVVQTGDLFFHGMPPYIDVAAGADTENWIRSLKTLAERYPDFKVIPGHGRVAGMEELGEFAAYLAFLRKQVGAAIQAGRTRQQAMDAIDMSAFAHLKERGDFLTLRNNIGWVYDEVSRKTK